MIREEDKEVRTCIFCGSKFKVAAYLPYVSCSSCRNKEAYRRSLTVKNCLICGKQFSTVPSTFVCRSCVNKLKTHPTCINTKCSKCGKLFARINGMPDMCCLCYKDSIRTELGICVYCGKPTGKKAKVCSACKRIYADGGRVCLNCKNGFTKENGSDIAFCSLSCKEEWESVHTGKSRCETLHMTNQDIIDKAVELMSENPSMTCVETIRLLNVPSQTLVRRGIVLSEARAANGLPSFRANKSIFEDLVYSAVKNVWPDVVREKRFDDLRDKRALRYDFYIPSINLLIEADGPQHYDKVTGLYSYLNDDNVVQKHDAAKNKYAKSKKISLLRVLYFREEDSHSRLKDLTSLLTKLQCVYQETGKLELFNCWNGGDKLLPISSQASTEEGSETRS